MATDSRLRCGRAWDVAQKILPLPRTYCAICFAGDTDDAYPLMLSMASAISEYPKSRSRGMDIYEVKGHTLRVFDHLLQFISDLPHGQTIPDPPKVEFIFGGYSWRKKKFVIWLFHYDTRIRKFTFREASIWRGGGGKKRILFAGDHIKEAKARLVTLLKSRGRIKTGGFDMEPFEVLRDMIREGQYQNIGGSPQVLKVYPFMNTQIYAVYWPNREAGSITVLGRPLLHYEIPSRLVLDPDTLKASDVHHVQNPPEA